MKFLFNGVIAFFLFISVSKGQFDSRFEEYLEETMIFLDEEVDPIGLSISVRSADAVWSDAIGISSVEDSLTSTSVLAMGSITKTFISAGILKLMEDQELTLSDPLYFYLPSFENIDSTITIKELLNHTSGVHDYSLHPEYYNTLLVDSNQFYSYTPEEIIEQFVLEKEFDRGTNQGYSNTNYILLGMIISEIANRPYFEEIFARFNTQQNYSSVSCPPFDFEISELADLWTDFGNGFENVSASGIGLDGLFSSVGASGAFVSTADDLSKWGYDLYAGKLLSRNSMDSLFEFGLGVEYASLDCEINTVGHRGAIFYGADLAYSQELDLCVVVMTNDNSEDGFSEIGDFWVIADEIICAYKGLIATGSSDVIDLEQIEIYPNPAHDIVNIILPQTVSQSVQIEVYNEMGSLVYAAKHLNDHSQILNINTISQLGKGVYLIKIFDNENSYTEKFVKI